VHHFLYAFQVDKLSENQVQFYYSLGTVEFGKFKLLDLCMKNIIFLYLFFDVVTFISLALLFLLKKYRSFIFSCFIFPISSIVDYSTQN
jgi:hypothetical protein